MLTSHITITIPAAVKLTLNTLYANNFEAYIVGGCVRDCIMGETPKDWDVTTNATPDEVKRLFKKTFDVGARFGTVTVMQGKEPIEVTTYRCESGYSDGRHPDNVTFAGNLEEDLSRRDFTINAMAYNEKRGLVDAFGGEKDILNRCIRCVGDPVERFKEDALRMLRAIRFSARFDFSIEENTWNAIVKNADNIKKISIERIRDEFIQTALTRNTDRLVLLKESGILSFFLPEIMSLNFSSVNLQKFPEDIIMRLAYLFNLASFCDKKKLNNCLRNFRLDKKSIQMINLLIDYSNYFEEQKNVNSIEIKRCVAQTSKESFLYLCEYLRLLGRESEKLLQLYNDIKEKNECISIKDLKINGYDLTALGLKGSEVGTLLQTLLEDVYNDDKKNNRQSLIELASFYYSKSRNIT